MRRLGRLATGITFAATAISPAAQAQTPHRCAADARVKAERLLAFHFADGEASPTENAGVDDAVRVLSPLRALRGKGVFDVLEVIGHVYRTDYRIRLIYARIPGACTLMGQEVIELSDPY